MKGTVISKIDNLKSLLQTMKQFVIDMKKN